MLNSRLVGVIWPGHPTRWRDVPGRVLPFAVFVLRLTIAAILAYLLTYPFNNHPGMDLTGPLTALLVLQASTLSTLRMGLVRVGAVLSGVLIAIFLSNWIGLTWWSLGAAIAAAIIVARLLNLREQMLEAPISAMLILGVANHSGGAEIRVLNTLVGAGVGMVMGMLFPTALAAYRVINSLKRASEAAAAPLDAAAQTLENEPPTRDHARGWLDQARNAASTVADASDAVVSLRERRRWNPRAIGTTDVVPVLDSALDTFDRCLLSIRALFTAMITELPEPPEQGADQQLGRANRADGNGADGGGADGSGADGNGADGNGADGNGADGQQAEDRFGDELRQMFAVVLSQTADCLRAFGDLVVAEAEGREEEAEEALRKSLEYAGETRAMLTDLMLVNPSGTQSWLLRGTLIVALEHLLDELRLENRERVRAARRTQPLPIVVQSVLPHPDRPYPRAVDMVLDRRRMVRERPARRRGSDPS